MIKWKQLINKDTPTEWQTELLEARAFTQNGRIGRNFGDTSLLWHTPLQLVGSGGGGGKIFKKISWEGPKILMLAGVAYGEMKNFIT